MRKWRLRLLGDCELIGPAGERVALSTRKSLAMLAYLARQEGKRVRRGRIAALLWEDANQDQSRLHVRKAIWILRRENDQLLVSNGEWVALNGGCLDTDVDEFADAVAKAGDDPALLQAACNLYAGDFLDDFSVRNSPAFEDWAMGERQRLRELAIGAMRRLLDLLVPRPDRTEAALAAALRLLKADPLQEHAHRALMRLHVRQGRPGAALSQYHDLRGTLARELGVEPEAETQALFREISQGRRAERAHPMVAAAPVALARNPQEQARPGDPSAKRPWVPALAAVVTVLAIAAVFLWNRRESVAPPEVTRVFPIATDLVMTGRPALSPDGSRLVFTARRPDDKNVDLYLMTIGDTRPVRLTHHPDVDDNAAWSPDGTRIAFARMTRDGSEPCRLLVMTVPGGSERPLGRCRTSLKTSVAWSADGREILYSDQQDSDQPQRIKAVDLNSGAVRVLTDPPSASFGDREPAPSPDGRSVAFLRDAAGRSSDLLVTGVRGGPPRRLSSGGGVLNGLAWSGNGKGLFFSSDRGGDLGLWWIATNGGKPHRLSAGLLDYRRLSAARDRPLLVFEAVSDRSQLFVARASGGAGAVEPLPRLAANARDTFPDVRSDGAIVFVSTRSGEEQLWIAPPDGSPRQASQFDGWRVSDPRWSPDGRHIAFVASKDGATDLYVMRSEGGAPVRLTHDAAEDAAPAWSPDGRQLYFGSRRDGSSRIWRIDPFVRAPTPVAVSEPGPGDLRIDPRGRWIYYLRPGQPGIWRRRLGNNGSRLAGPEQKLVADFAPLDWINWAVSADAVYYAARPAGIGEGWIKRLDLATGLVSLVADARAVHRSSSFAVDASGNLILPVRNIEVDLFGMEFLR